MRFEEARLAARWLLAACALLLAACGPVTAVPSSAQAAIINPPACVTGDTLCDCGACDPEYACFPSTLGGGQSCVSFCRSCTPRPSPTPPPVACTPTCLAGGCPGIVNVRSCTTPACTLVPSPPPADDYQLLMNAAAYVNKYNASPSPKPVTMVYPGIFNVTEHSQNAFGAAVCSATVTTQCCPTAPSALPVVFGNPAGNPDDTSTQVNNFHLIGCPDPTTGAAAAINVAGDFARHADIQADPGSAEWISCNDGVTPFQIANANNFSISGIELNGNNQLTTKPDDQGCSTGTCSVFVAEGNSYGIYIQTSNTYVLNNLDVHNFGTDGLAVGEAIDSAHWDSGATVTGVASHHNGRDGLSIFQLKNSSFNRCRLSDNGKPCQVDSMGNWICGKAAYAGEAGVDIEPNNAGAIVVDGVTFKQYDLREQSRRGIFRPSFRPRCRT